MMSSIAVLAGVGLVCASGVVVSTAFKFFHTFEYDLTAKLKESKKETKKEIGGEQHELRMQKLSGKVIDKL